MTQNRVTRSARTIVAALALAVVIAAAPAAAQASAREGAGPLGNVSMAREATTTADGTAAVAADASLNVSVAKENGARWLLVSVGNDGNAALKMQGVGITEAGGGAVAVERTEGDGTNRVQWWLDVAGLPDVAELSIQAKADPAGTRTDVETLIMAFDSGYQALNTAGGTPLTLQSFTTVRPSGDGGSFQGPATNTTDNSTVTDNTTGNETDPLVNDTAEDDPVEEVGDGNETPALGALAVFAGVGAAAYLTRRRG